MIRFTIMEAHGFTSYQNAGEVIDYFENKEKVAYRYAYRMMYISKGIVVSVWEDGKLKGYLG